MILKYPSLIAERMCFSVICTRWMITCVIDRFDVKKGIRTRIPFNEWLINVVPLVFEDKCQS